MKICNSSQTVLLIISLLNIIAIFSSCEDWYNLGLFDVAIQFYAFTIFSLKLSLNHVWASYIIGVHFINCNRKTFTWNIIIKQSLASLSLIIRIFELIWVFFQLINGFELFLALVIEILFLITNVTSNSFSRRGNLLTRFSWISYYLDLL